MGRPKSLAAVLTDDQLPMWTEAKLDPQPFPVAMLKRLATMADSAFRGTDAQLIKKLSDAMRDWYALAAPGSAAPNRDSDEWEQLSRAFAAADAATRET